MNPESQDWSQLRFALAIATLCVGLICSTAPNPAAAQSTPKETPPASKDSPAETKKPEATSTPESDAAGKKDRRGSERENEELLTGEAAEQDPVVWLERAITGMRKATQQLTRSQPAAADDEPLLERQSRAVADLQKIIDLLEKSQNPSQSQNSNNSDSSEQDQQNQQSSSEKNSQSKSSKSQSKSGGSSSTKPGGTSESNGRRPGSKSSRLARQRQKRRDQQRLAQRAGQPQMQPGQPQPQPGEAGPGPMDQQAANGGPPDPNSPEAQKAAEEALRQKLVKDVWGHLPPSLREQLLNVYSERYLPKYDEMVRKYYEALAEQNSRRSQDSGSTGGAGSKKSN